MTDVKKTWLGMPPQHTNVDEQEVEALHEAVTDEKKEKIEESLTKESVTWNNPLKWTEEEKKLIQGVWGNDEYIEVIPTWLAVKRVIQAHEDERRRVVGEIEKAIESMVYRSNIPYLEWEALKRLVSNIESKLSELSQS